MFEYIVNVDTFIISAVPS